MQTTEQRLERLERHNRRLTTALTLMAVAMCAAVTMAATGDKDDVVKDKSGRFTDLYVSGSLTVMGHVLGDSLDVRKLTAVDANLFGVDAGKVKTGILEAQHVWVNNDAGKTVVGLGADDDGNGLVTTNSAQGKDLVDLSATVDGEGTVTTYQPNGKRLVTLSASDSGGLVYVYNKTGEFIAEMSADEYGNGVVGAWNRKGKGRTLQPGP